MQKLSVLIIFMVVAMVIITAETSLAQNSENASSVLSKIDTLFIGDYTDLLTTRIYSVFQDASIMSNPGNIDKIVYRPNVDFRLGIGANYKWLGIGLSVENLFPWRNAGLYGKTSSLDLRVNAFGRSVAGELFYQNYRGFYISYPQRSDHSYYLMPDMASVSFGAAGYWIYNAQKFSLRAAFIQNERQKKSAGSFLVRPSVLYFRLSSDHGIIPEELARQYNIPVSNQFTGGTVVALGLAPGYSYTIIFLKYVYISGTVLPGVAAQFYTFEADAGDYHDFEFVLKAGVRVAMGYNSGKWFIGGALQTSLQSVPDRLSQALFDYDLFQLRIWGGLRFDLFRKKSVSL